MGSRELEPLYDLSKFEWGRATIITNHISVPPPCGLIVPLLEWASLRGPHARLDLTLP